MDPLVFLAGLMTGFGMTLAGVIWLARRPAQGNRQQPTERTLFCTVCETPVGDPRKAREHCKDEHNAPDNSSADHLLTEATVEREQ